KASFMQWGRQVLRYAATLTLVTTVRLITGAAQEPLVVQIVSPSPGAKLRPDSSIPVEIRVTGGREEQLSWQVLLRAAENDESHFASGSGRGGLIHVGDLSANTLRAGST